MKRMILSLVAMLTAVMASQAMTYTQARQEALFLTDKMAYELGLTESQYDAVYEINFDYMSMLSSKADLYGTGWYRRNLDLGYVLTAAQYNRYCTMEYFYRPVYWSSGFRYRIYSRYTDRSRMYCPRPKTYTAYRGGHSWKSNGGKSWYKGRTFSAGKRVTAVKKMTVNKTTVNKTTVSTGTRKHSSASKGSHAVKRTGSFKGKKVER